MAVIFINLLYTTKLEMTVAIAIFAFIRRNLLEWEY